MFSRVFDRLNDHLVENEMVSVPISYKRAGWVKTELDNLGQQHTIFRGSGDQIFVAVPNNSEGLRVVEEIMGYRRRSRGPRLFNLLLSIFLLGLGVYFLALTWKSISEEKTAPVAQAVEQGGNQESTGGFPNLGSFLPEGLFDPSEWDLHIPTPFDLMPTLPSLNPLGMFDPIWEFLGAAPEIGNQARITIVLVFFLFICIGLVALGRR